VTNYRYILGWTPFIYLQFIYILKYIDAKKPVTDFMGIYKGVMLKMNLRPNVKPALLFTKYFEVVRWRTMIRLRWMDKF
jgi:hypothetical protein